MVPSTQSNEWRVSTYITDRLKDLKEMRWAKWFWEGSEENILMKVWILKSKKKKTVEIISSQCDNTHKDKDGN